MQIHVNNLTIPEANDYLKSIDMEIGSWGQIKPLYKNRELKKINYPAPGNARELFNFASHIASWLPKGSWKLFQMDNSSHMDAYDAYLFGKLLFGKDEIVNFGKYRTFLFKSGISRELDISTELLISNLICFYLLFESHGQIVTSSCGSKILSIHDGFVYFISDDSGLSEAKAILESYESNPLISPDWVATIIADIQERDISE
jgi:hypothetical protein